MEKNVCKDWCGEVCQNISESFKIQHKNWQRRCNCYKKHDIALEDDKEEALKNERHIKQTAMQLTLARKSSKLRTKLSTDLLLFYLSQLTKPEFENEYLDMRFVQDLLNEGSDLNYVNDNSENALFFAIQLESEELVQYLLEKNTNFMLKNKDGLTVFHVVGHHENLNILKLLVDKFTDAGQKLEDYIDCRSNKELHTPLHRAAMFGSKAIAESLIVDYNVNREAVDYKNRTPLYIAAEYNRKFMVKTLMSLKCNVGFIDSKTKKDVLCNDKGQTAMYWIVTKMPDIAQDALDQLYEPNPYMRKDKHYMLPLHPKILKPKLNQPKIAQKTVLSSIVESNNLDLIVHPTISCLIDIKWRVFARINAWIELLLTIIYLAVWITFALWVPWNLKHRYDFSGSDADRFRFSLFIIGIIFTIYLVISEIIEVYNDYKFEKKCSEMRLKELEDYQNDAHFVKEEKSQLLNRNKFSFMLDYIMDPCINDIAYHSTYMAETHIRIMSFTIIIISFRLLKSSRVVFPKFGYLVMIIYYAISDIVIWIILYVIIWLSFCCSFWMIFGNVQFTNESSQNPVCVDVTQVESNNANNCTTASVDGFSTYDLTAYYLFRLTFGNALDETNMQLIDNVMTNPLIGAYIGFTSLILVNIFIAILTNTVNRVWEKAVAYVVLQRALVIVSQEKAWHQDQHKDHAKYLRDKCCPYIDETYHEIITSADDKINSLEEELKEQRKTLKEMSNSLDEAHAALKKETKYKNITEKMLVEEISQLKEILLNFMNAQASILNDREMQMQSNKPPQFDFLHVSEFTAPTDVIIS